MLRIVGERIATPVCALARNDIQFFSPDAPKLVLNVPNSMSLRGAERRGNLLIRFIEMLYNTDHCARRLPRLGFAPPRNDSGNQYPGATINCSANYNLSVYSQFEAAGYSGLKLLF